MGENGVCERLGSCGDFGVHVDEEEKGVIDVGADGGGARGIGDPGWGGDASVDEST